MESTLRGIILQARIVLRRWVDRTFGAREAQYCSSNGADIRYIHAMLGHADLKTTQIYTQVTIRHQKQIHTATHPAQLPRKDGEAKPDEAARETLLSALAAEEDAEEEEES